MSYSGPAWEGRKHTSKLQAYHATCLNLDGYMHEEKKAKPGSRIGLYMREEKRSQPDSIYITLPTLVDGVHTSQVDGQVCSSREIIGEQ